MKGFWRGYGICTAMGGMAGLVIETYGPNRIGLEWFWLGYFVIAALLTWGIWDQ